MDQFQSYTRPRRRHGERPVGASVRPGLRPGRTRGMELGKGGKIEGRAGARSVDARCNRALHQRRRAAARRPASRAGDDDGRVSIWRIGSEDAGRTDPGRGAARLARSVVRARPDRRRRRAHSCWRSTSSVTRRRTASTISSTARVRAIRHAARNSTRILVL